MRFRKLVSRIILVSQALLLIMFFQNCGFNVSDSLSKEINTQQKDLADRLIAPSVQLAFPMTGSLKGPDITIHLQVVKDPTAALTTVTCQFDNLPFQDCRSLSATATGLADGQHSLRVSVEDSYGQVSEPFRIFFVVDTIIPIVNFTSVPPAITGGEFASVTFNATDELSAISLTECSLDDAPFTSCSTNSTFTALAAGTHTLRVRATDTAGNISAIKSATWRNDLTAPTVSVSSQPTAFTKSTEATFRFSGMDEGVAISAFECALDGGSFSSCASGKKYTGLTQGAHSFSLRGKDNAGLYSAVTNISWTVDLTSPAAPTLSANLSSPTKQRSVQLQFLGTDTESGVGSYQCAVDGGAFTTCESPKSYEGLTNGTKKFKVRTVDRGGNISANAELELKVDLLAPVVTISHAPSGTMTATAVEFIFSVADVISGVQSVQCRLDDGAFETCASPKVYSGLSAGSHRVTLRATDLVGNTADKEVNWNISCGETLHLEGGVCVPNLRSCNIDNGQGMQAWNGTTYAACTVLSCNSGFHPESNQCLPNVKSCAVDNGSGTKTWNGTTYGNCLANACHSGYVLFRYACPATSTAVPTSLGLNSFYKKYLNAGGVPVVASSVVPDSALYAAREIVLNMTSKNHALRKELAKQSRRVAVMGRAQVTRDLPEQKSLPAQWDVLHRGLPGTSTRPVSGAEENLLCLGGTKDMFHGEGTFVNYFARSVYFALPHTETNALVPVEVAFKNAMDSHLWGNTIVLSNSETYFAEMSQIWFHANPKGPVGGDGTNNEISTRDLLKIYDRKSWDLMNSIYGNATVWSCPRGSGN